jgi:hypothetical protein
MSQLKIAYTKLQSFIERFTTTYDSQNATATSAFSTSAPLVQSLTIGSGLLLGLANLKRGGP